MNLVAGVAPASAGERLVNSRGATLASAPGIAGLTTAIHQIVAMRQVRSR